jgi:hypothetical protein
MGRPGISKAEAGCEYASGYGFLCAGTWLDWRAGHVRLSRNTARRGRLFRVLETVLNDMIILFECFCHAEQLPDPFA